MEGERKFRKNSVLEIQTGESGAICITKEKYLNENSDNEYYYYKVVNIYEQPDVFLENTSTTFEGCLDILEARLYEESCSSWWLLTQLVFMDESIKPIVFKRILFYDLTGLLVTAARKSISDDRIYGKPVFEEWLHLAGIQPPQSINYSYKDCITSMDRTIIKEKQSWVGQISVYFEGFDEAFLIPECKLNANGLQSFQQLLNYLYHLISGHVSKHSYDKEWGLANVTEGKILSKVGMQDGRTLSEAGIQIGDKLLCRKLK